MSLVLPQGIGHEAKISVQFYEAEQLAFEVDKGHVALDAQQKSLLSSKGSLAVADSLGKEQILDAGISAIYENETAYNVVTTIGTSQIVNAIVGNNASGTTATASTVFWNFGKARVCIGNGNSNATWTPTSAATSLYAASHAGSWWNQPVNYPGSSGVTLNTSSAPYSVTWVAQIPSGQGNFAWYEWGIDGGSAGTQNGNGQNGAADANSNLFNVASVYLGTKVTGTTATLTVTVTES